MKITSAEANKMIKQLRDEIAYWKVQEQNGSRFIAATIENVESVSILEHNGDATF